MDLTLTRRGDYALRAAIALGGSDPDAFLKAREVSEVMSIPRSYTAQVLGILVGAGIAEARAGREGGYRLVRPASEISVLEVVEAAEGPLASQNCPMRGGPCHWEQVCAIHGTWARASEAVREAMRASDLAQVSAEDARIAASVRSSRKRSKGRV